MIKGCEKTMFFFKNFFLFLFSTPISCDFLELYKTILVSTNYTKIDTRTCLYYRCLLYPSLCLNKFSYLSKLLVCLFANIERKTREFTQEIDQR